MTSLTTSPSELIDPNSRSRPSPAAIARWVQETVKLWGATRQARVTSYIARLLDLRGVEEPERRARESVDHTVALGEVERATVHGQPWLMPTFPRLVRVAADLQLVLGEGLEILAVEPNEDEEWCAANTTRWLPLSREAVSERHADLNYVEQDLVDWLGEPGWATTFERLSGRRSGTLTELWGELERAVAEHGVPSDGPARLRVVLGEPGDFFGGVRGERIEAKSGRWSGVDDLRDGVYVGARPGPVSSSWRQCVVSASGGELKVLDLWDWEELCWALIARGVSAGKREVVNKRTGGSYTVTMPAPRQVQRLLSCMGPPDPQRKWTYMLPTRVQAAVTAALGGLGLEVVTQP